MGNTKKHYENHLAGFYSWMLGDFEARLKETEEYFQHQGILPKGNKHAIDLGCGSGMQSIPLALLGFDVTAVDFSKKLLDELNARKGNLNIKILEADIMDFDKYSNKTELIVCMGDTLTHLNSIIDVKKLFINCKIILEPNGKFIISYRDLSNELKGESRFISVRSTDDTVFTCFLEYEKDYVNVNDIINFKTADGWVQRVSSYKKLRLPVKKVKQLLGEIKFKIYHEKNIKGFIFLICSN
jgi:SAM-dependent methyltransferase